MTSCIGFLVGFSTILLFNGLKAVSIHFKLNKFYNILCCKLWLWLWRYSHNTSNSFWKSDSFYSLVFSSSWCNLVHIWR